MKKTAKKETTRGAAKKTAMKDLSVASKVGSVKGGVRRVNIEIDK